MANIISDETIEYVGILAKLELSDEEKKLSRFRKIAEEACKQCGRACFFGAIGLYVVIRGAVEKIECGNVIRDALIAVKLGKMLPEERIVVHLSVIVEHNIYAFAHRIRKADGIVSPLCKIHRDPAKIRMQKAILIHVDQRTVKIE